MHALDLAFVALLAVLTAVLMAWNGLWLPSGACFALSAWAWLALTGTSGR